MILLIPTIQDCKDVYKLLSADNVNHSRLLKFSKDAADFSTKYQLPHHDFAVNHYNKEDVAMFDFTSIHQAENSSRIFERKGKRLLMCIAGDVLLEVSTIMYRHFLSYLSILFYPYARRNLFNNFIRMYKQRILR